MVNAAKCPGCNQVVASVEIEHVNVTQNFQNKWHGVSYACPHCATVLGVSLDPIALKTDIVQEVVRGIFDRVRQTK